MSLFNLKSSVYLLKKENRNGMFTNEEAIKMFRVEIVINIRHFIEYMSAE
jgi:hypothetical protein